VLALTHMDPTLEHTIVACPTLPSLPAVALEVEALCRREDLDVGEVPRGGRHRVVERG
jgi:hypothetical protein